MKPIFLILFLVCSMSAHAQLRFVKEVGSIADLKQLNVNDVNKTCNVKYYVSPGDGGGGVFEYESSVVTYDSGIRIEPNIGGGGWVRKVAGRDYIARWWGPSKTNATLQAAIDWVAANGGGKVIADGGSWSLKSDDATRITMKSDVFLSTAEDSELVCAPSPTTNWILVDFPLDVRNCGVGPARMVGWNLTPPGGNPLLSGVIFSLQDTHNVTIGGVRASNWWSQYADVGSGNENLQMFDHDWLLGAMSFGAVGDGITDDTKNLQSYLYFCERYGREFFMRSTTNGYLTTSVWVTNNTPVKFRGEKTLVKAYYYNPTEGVLPHPSSFLTISADNCQISGFVIQTVGSYPVTETNSATTGFFVPINIHLATNTFIANCDFDVESGKAIVSSGSGTRIENCFFSRCGATFGLGNRQDWLFYEAASPFKGQKYSPLSVSVVGCTFVGGSPYKHTMFFSSASDFLFSGNKMVNMNSPNPLVIYSGDEGVTDSKGTNVYDFSGKVIGNTITGTNFGANGAICVRLNTPTNYITDVGFVVSNMFSSVIITDNHIHGDGPAAYSGIQLIIGKGTKILNNDVRSTGTPVHLVGNCDDVIIDGNYLKSSMMGAAASIGFSVGFLAPDSFNNVVVRNNTIVTPSSEEYAIRNVEPIILRNFTLSNNRFEFHGAAGAGDAPRIVQLTKSEGFIDISYNKFYVTNSLHNRPIVYVSGTNCDLTFDLNKSFTFPGSVVTRKGLTSLTKSARVSNNDVGGMEFNNNTEIVLSRNFLSSSNTYPYPLEVVAVDRASIIGNTISNYFNGDAACAVITATNSTFAENLIAGNSANPLVISTIGKMYVNNNPIKNLGAGGALVGATAPGVLSHTVYERPFHLNIGASTDIPFSIQRDGSPATNWFTIDQWFTGSSRDAQYHIGPYNTNDMGGHAFFVHMTNGLEQFVFGAHGFNPPVFYIGDPTNSLYTFIGGLGTNTLLYLDDNRLLQRVTLGANMTFAGGTLNSIAGGGGGSTNDTPWNLDHDANAFSLTNLFGLELRKTSSSEIDITLTNSASKAVLSLQSGSWDINNANSSSVNYMTFGTTSGSSGNGINFSSAGIGFSTTGKNIGSASIPANSLDVQQIRLASNVTITWRNGSPEGVITAPPGSILVNTNGGAGATFWVKETGVSNTGWVAYRSSATGTIPTSIQLACSDLTTPITAGTFKAYFRMPYAMTVTGVRASLAAAQTAGTIFTVDINEAGVSILSTKLTIDATEKTSTTAAIPAVVSDTSLADDAEISVDVDSAGTSPSGLVITINGLR